MVREGRTNDLTDKIHLLTRPLNVSYKVTESVFHVIIPVLKNTHHVLLNKIYIYIYIYCNLFHLLCVFFFFFVVGLARNLTMLFIVMMMMMIMMRTAIILIMLIIS